MGPRRRRSSRAALSAVRLGRARCGGDLSRVEATVAERSSGPGPGWAGRRDRRDQPARDAVVWERDSGRPHGQAIVWQDRRTGARLRRAAQPRAGGADERGKPACSSTPSSRARSSSGCWTRTLARRVRARQSELLLGTIDSCLIWKLTGAADPSDRCHQRPADAALRPAREGMGRRDARLLDVPMAVVPEVRDCAADFGTNRGVSSAGKSRSRRRGDQQAAHSVRLLRAG